MMKRSSNFVSIFWLVVVLCSVYACTRNSDSEYTHTPPDVSKISVDVSIRRFDRELLALDTNNLQAGIEKLYSNDPEFVQLYLLKVIGAQNPKDTGRISEHDLRYFLRFPEPFRKLYDTCQIVFNTMDGAEKELGEAFRYYKYYFPERPTPTVTTMVSEYGIRTFIYGNDQIAVSLDYFLGREYPYQQLNPGNPNFSSYLSSTYAPPYVAAAVVRQLIDDMTGNPSGAKLLDWMVHNGKKIYILDHLMPHAPDSIKLELSPAQIAWCKDNEQDMWAFFTSQNYLYNSKQKDIRKFIERSPDSPGMPPEAPGNTASFIGWRIVSQYMKLHPKTTLSELIELRDAQQLLTNSKYKPKRR